MIIILFVYQVTDTVLVILSYAIFLRVLLSWIPNLPYNAFVRVLHDITDPLIRPFERIQFGGPGFAISLAPIFAYLAIMVTRTLVLPALFSIFI